MNGQHYQEVLSTTFLAVFGLGKLPDEWRKVYNHVSRNLECVTERIGAIPANKHKTLQSLLYGFALAWTFYKAPTGRFSVSISDGIIRDYFSRFLAEYAAYVQLSNLTEDSDTLAQSVRYSWDSKSGSGYDMRESVIIITDAELVTSEFASYKAFLQGIRPASRVNSGLFLISQGPLDEYDYSACKGLEFSDFEVNTVIDVDAIIRDIKEAWETKEDGKR